MFQNNHIWDIWLKASLLEIPEGQEFPIIPGSSIRGKVRSFLENLQEWQTYSKEIFGELDFIGSISFSDLNLDPDGPPTEIQTRSAVCIPTNARSADNVNLYSRNIIVEPSFRGNIILRNGGIYPAVFTRRIIQNILKQIRIGPGTNRGYGKVKSCQLSRNFVKEENLVSSPIHRNFRNANILLIEELSKNPKVIYDIEWRDLERIMAQIFEEIGFNVELTDASHDGGKDLILSCLSSQSSERTPLKFYVEIKHWKTKVGISPIHKLIEVVEKDAVTGCVFVSTSGFASTVTENAEIRKKVRLEDLSDLYTYFRYYQRSRSEEFFLVKTLEEILDPKDL